MHLYEMADVKENILEAIADDEYSIDNLRDTLSAFLDYTGDYKNVIAGMIASEVEYAGNGEEFLKYLYEIFASTEMTDAEKRDILTPVMIAFAECSDEEDFSGGKIYVVIKGMDIVKEYDSWENAEKDVDDWYTGCCDDIYFAETALFPILCGIQNREWDECLNYCIVFEFDATDIEDGRESWEESEW